MLIYLLKVLHVFNRSLEVVPSGMKLANVIPVHKKGNQYDRGNYQPVSILPNLSKQISKYYSRYHSVKISMRFQKRAWYEALFNSPTREIASNYRLRTRIWYSSN